MAIVFLQKRKFQKNLIFVFLAIILIMAVLIWQGLFNVKINFLPSFEGAEVASPEEVNINFGVLKNPLIGQLQLFPEIKPLEGGNGRENPFLPY